MTPWNVPYFLHLLTISLIFHQVSNCKKSGEEGGKNEKYLISERKAKGSVHPLWNREGKLIVEDVEKTEVFKAFYTSVFTKNVNC